MFQCSQKVRPLKKRILDPFFMGLQHLLASLYPVTSLGDSPNTPSSYPLYNTLQLAATWNVRSHSQYRSGGGGGPRIGGEQCGM